MSMLSDALKERLKRSGRTYKSPVASKRLRCELDSGQNEKKSTTTRESEKTVKNVEKDRLSSGHCGCQSANGSAIRDFSETGDVLDLGAGDSQADSYCEENSSQNDLLRDADSFCFGDGGSGFEVAESSIERWQGHAHAVPSQSCAAPRRRLSKVTSGSVKESGLQKRTSKCDSVVNEGSAPKGEDSTNPSTEELATVNFEHSHLDRHGNDVPRTKESNSNNLVQKVYLMKDVKLISKKRNSDCSEEKSDSQEINLIYKEANLDSNLEEPNSKSNFHEEKSDFHEEKSHFHEEKLSSCEENSNSEKDDSNRKSFSHVGNCGSYENKSNPRDSTKVEKSGHCIVNDSELQLDKTENSSVQTAVVTQTSPGSKHTSDLCPFPKLPVSKLPIGSDGGRCCEESESDCVGAQDHVEKLKARRLELLASVSEKEEQLRKLNMVKMYRAKNDLNELQELINKWRVVSQDALQELVELASEPKPSLTELVGYLQLDHKFIGFNPESETFTM